MTKVAVYNQGGTELLMTVSVKKALTMLHRGVVSILTPTDDSVGSFIIPKAVQLVKYIYAKWKYAKRKSVYSKEAVMVRDNNICGYCLNHATTMDHIVPRCQGGPSTWMNTIASCRKCNLKKGGRTPQEAGMKLLNKPFIP